MGLIHQKSFRLFYFLTIFLFLDGRLARFRYWVSYGPAACAAFHWASGTGKTRHATTIIRGFSTRSYLAIRRSRIFLGIVAKKIAKERSAFVETGRKANQPMDEGPTAESFALT